MLIPKVVHNPSPCSWVSGAALVLSLRQLCLSQQTERSLLKGQEVIGGPKSWNLFLLDIVTGALPLDTAFLLVTSMKTTSNTIFRQKTLSRVSNSELSLSTTGRIALQGCDVISKRTKLLLSVSVQ